MNYYEHHLGDYAEATAHLSFIEDAAYSRLMRKVYATELPLPADIKSVQRLVGARTKEEREAVAVVLEEFFVLESDGWHNDRCDIEIGKYQKKALHNREVGKLGGRPRKTKTQPVITEKPTNNPVGLFEEPKHNPPQSPVTSNHSSVPEGTGGDPPRSAAEKSKSELWKAAVSLLNGQGMPEAQARSFIGKLSKDYPTDDIVLKSVQGAVSEQPADARAYLKATCQRLAGERKRDGSADWTAAAI